MRAIQSRCIVTGLGCAALALCWQFVTVHFNYSGNWTALFCSGSNMRQPPLLANERIYVFANSNGYDGQFYHYLAHDPLLTGGLAAVYIDAPRLRCRRILMPAIAYMLAVGRQEFIDRAYLATNLIFIFLGVYWLGLWCVTRGLDAIWGGAFLLVPATLISIDRLTIDISLAALCGAFALFTERERGAAVWFILAAAGLARETGLLLVGGYAAYLLLNGKWLRAMLSGAAAIPALAWFVYVQTRTSTYNESWTTFVPLAGWVGRILHPMRYGYGGPILVIATLLDYVALAGMGLAMLLGLRMAIHLRRSPAAASVVLFASLAIFISSGEVWIEAYSYGRVFTPLLLLLPLSSAAPDLRLNLLPLALVSPRVALQFGSQVYGVLRGIAQRRS